jgi:hypothetical protein
MKEENKLCWFCKYFYYSQAEPDYSEYTPGTEFSMECGKGHWRFNAYRTSQEEFGRILATAQMCEDFVQIEGIK